MKNFISDGDFSRGFTLIELLVTITILGVMASVAMPSFQQLINNNRIVSETNGLVADFALARSEALRRGGVLMTVCASIDGSTCSGAGNWASGRLIFAESSATGTIGAVDSGESITRNSVGSTGVTVVSTGFSTLGYVAYNSTGAITSTTPGAVTICRTGYTGRVVSVSTTGRVSLSKTSTSCP